MSSDFSVRSGVETIISNKLEMKLDTDGQYKAMLIKGSLLSDKEKKALAEVDAMSGKGKNEDQIGAELFANLKGIKHDSTIGYYQDLYVGYVAEGDFRKNGSSGGMVTWLLNELLKQKIVDGVIHMQKAPSKSGKLFHYQISRTEKDILSGAKTRYYPGELSSVLDEVKRHKGHYAIVGIPSFIMEVRLLANYDPIFKERIKCTIGLVCGHQKSANYSENIAWQCGIQPGNLLGIDYRKKVDGRPASDYVTEVTGIINGKKTTILHSQSELFGVNWGHGFFKTQFSDYTDDAFNETADAVFGDAWLPQYVADSKGTNVVIIRNNNIAKVIHDGVSNNKLHLEVVNPSTIIKSQSGLVHHIRDELPYRLYKLDKQNKWRPKKRMEASARYPFSRKIVQELRLKIAHESRIQYMEAIRRNDWQYFYKKMRKYTVMYALVYNYMLISRLTPKEFTKKVITKGKRIVEKII